MKAIELLKMSLDQSKGWVMGLLSDMQDAPLTVPTPHGGNHPLWILGHLAYSEAQLTQEMALGQPNPLADWKDLFGQHSQPVLDANRYPSFEELMGKFEETRAETLRLLDSLSDENLDQPSHVSEEMKDFFGTIGHCLSAIAIHSTFHGGQVADARRAAGRPPLMG